MIRTALSIVLALSIGCSATSAPAPMCLGTDVLPYPGEESFSPDDACSTVQNMVETRLVILECAGSPPPITSCAYYASPTGIARHSVEECLEVVRSAVTCEEVISFARLCYCEDAS